MQQKLRKRRRLENTCHNLRIYEPTLLARKYLQRIRASPLPLARRFKHYQIRALTMPTLLAHIAIAGLVCLAIVKNPKWILLLAWTAILPDFDIFLGLHRIAFHTLFLLIPVSVVIISIAYRWYPAYQEPAFIIAFCLLSHTILDWLQYWNALWWPIPLAFWLNIQITILPTSPIPTPLLIIGPMIAPLHALFEPSIGTLFDPYTSTLFLLFLAVAIIRIWPHLYQRLTSPSQTPTPPKNQEQPTDTGFMKELTSESAHASINWRGI